LELTKLKKIKIPSYVLDKYIKPLKGQVLFLVKKKDFSNFVSYEKHRFLNFTKTVE